MITLVVSYQLVVETFDRQSAKISRLGHVEKSMSQSSHECLLRLILPGETPSRCAKAVPVRNVGYTLLLQLQAIKGKLLAPQSTG